MMPEPSTRKVKMATPEDTILTKKKIYSVQEYLTKQRFERFTLWLFLILLLIIFYNMLTLFTGAYMLKNDSLAYKEFMTPLPVTLTSITADTCTLCPSPDQVAAALKAMNVAVTSEEKLAASSTEAKQLIAQYNIQKLPAVIFTGNFSSKQGMIETLLKFMTKKTDDVFVYEQTLPPYYDLTTKKTQGLVTLTLVTVPSCSDCVDVSQIGKQLEQILKIQQTKTAVYNSSEGDSLVAAYKLTFAPAVIISKDASAYPQFTQLWKQYGTVEDDGTYVMRNLNPPYLDLATGNVVGYVDVTYITDKSCADCYPVNLHKQILTGMGVKLRTEKTTDVSDAAGKALTSKYKISAVPTVVLSGDIAKYTGLTQVWNQVGTIEMDGSYVFRQLDKLQDVKYKNLTSN